MSDSTRPDDGQTGGDGTEPNLWQRLRARRSTRWAMDIALVLAVIGLISAYQTRHLLGGDDPLPPVVLESLDGSAFSLDELDSRRTIVYFWATWCGACDLQSGAISSLYHRADDDLQVISVVLHYDDVGQVIRHVEREGIDYPVFLGTDATAAAFNVQSFPTIYIIDDDLRIRHGLVGYTTRWGLQLRTWL